MNDYLIEMDRSLSSVQENCEDWVDRERYLFTWIAKGFRLKKPLLLVMRRITTTLFGVLAIIIILYMMSQTMSSGAPWIFSLAGIFMIFVIIMSIVRVWLRGY